MKIGLRKSSLKKSFKASTTGRLKRQVKKAVIPGYGKKGYNINTSSCTLRNIRNIENKIGINTKAKNTPAYCIWGGWICILLGTGVMTLLIIGLLLEITGLALMCRRNYWNAYRWNRAIIMYLKKNYTKSKKYLDKLLISEKETLAYEKMLNLLNGNYEDVDDVSEGELENIDDTNIEN